MHVRPSASLAALAASFVLTVSGCAGADDAPPPSNAGKEAWVLAEEVAALLGDEDRYRLTGYGNMAGNRVFMDLCVRDDGGMAGRITLDGIAAEVVAVDDTIYVKAPYEFHRWYSHHQVPAAEPPAFDGTKYVAFGSGFGRPPAIPVLTEVHNRITRGEVVRREGREVIPLLVWEGTRGTPTFLIPVEGEPYPVAALREDQSPYDVALTWGEACDPVAPPPSAVLGPDALQDPEPA